MFRYKDFNLMNVIDIKGKKIGYIDDIIINFHKGSVEGFSICSRGIIGKKTNVLKKDIVSFNESMIIKLITKDNFLYFKDIKNMDVIDNEGKIHGTVEDILFNKDSFQINGLILSTGIIKNFIYGKKIILFERLILGENNICYIKNNEELILNTLPHKLIGGK